MPRGDDPLGKPKRLPSKRDDTTASSFGDRWACPNASFPIGLIFKGVSWLWGKRFFNQVIRENGFRPGTSTMPQTVKSMDSEEDLQALVRFEQAVERLLAFDGKPHPSPLFGRLSLEEHTTLQKIHVQHHLRFLHPRDSWE